MECTQLVDSIGSQLMLDIPVPGSSMLHPRKGIVIPDNLESAIEVMTNLAAAPLNSEKEKQASTTEAGTKKGKGGKKTLGVETRRKGKRRRRFHRLNQPPSRLSQPPNPAAKAKPVVKERPKAKPKAKPRRKLEKWLKQLQRPRRPRLKENQWK